MSTGILTAIVGAGYWGTTLVRTFFGMEGIRLQAVCDTQGERLALLQSRYPSLRYTTCWESLLDDVSIQAVVLATPPATHFHLARMALTAGKHVWVEKPLALQYRDGSELVALAAATNRTLFVDETFLYDPLLQHGRAILSSGQLGYVQHLAFERTSMGRIRRDSNVWWNAAPHDLAILRYLLHTPISRVSVRGHALIQPQVEDVISATLEMKSRCAVHLYLNWLFPEKRGTLVVIGETGMLKYEGRFGQRTLMRYEYRLGQVSAKDQYSFTHTNLIPIESHNLVEDITDDKSEPLALACAAFRDAIVSGKRTPSSGDNSLPTLAVLEAGAQSLAQGGVWVNVEEGKG